MMNTRLRSSIVITKYIRYISDLQVLERVLRQRVSENNFATTDVSRQTLSSILRLTLLAPSRSYPYNTYLITCLASIFSRIK